MKEVIGLQAFLTFTGAAMLATCFSTRSSISYLFGALLVLSNLLLLWWTWHFILQKKLIALATSVIVFKYAIFAVIVYKVLNLQMTEGLWFGVGLSTLMATVLLYAIWIRFFPVEKPGAEENLNS